MTLLILLPDASKAAFMASPSSCFLANRNKAAAATADQSVKNEPPLGEHAYMSLSANHQQSLETSTVVYQGADAAGFTVSGKGQKTKKQKKTPVSCLR